MDSLRGPRRCCTTLQKELEKASLEAAVVPVGCIGMCYAEPTVEVIIPGKPKLTYGYATSDTIPSLVKALAKGKLLKKNLLYRTNTEDLVINGKTLTYAAKTPTELKKTPTAKDFPFFLPQTRITLRNAGLINPESIEEYCARGGYAALNKALNQNDTRTGN